MYFPNYEAALAKLREVLARGETNVDIGILQINWRANGYRLPNPAELLIPRNNIDVAAQMLRELLDRCNGDWSCAVARYHSPRTDLGEAYEASVRRIVERLRGIPGVLDVLAQ
ncbi:MAG: transglycosylase SLT domain-containing protein [Steroidobacteraceae bacterium]